MISKFFGYGAAHFSMIITICHFSEIISLTPLRGCLASSYLYGKGQTPMEETPQYKRMMNSGSSLNSSGNGKNGATKRSVSETKKKFVASRQGWTCNDCKNQLPAWFEVDHVVRLEHGGSNSIDNLVALCRDCHGRKTAMENM